VPRDPQFTAKLLRGAYAEVFGVPGRRTKSQELVLANLAKYCHARTTTFVSGDSHATATLEGRRQVWVGLILFYLSLSDEDVEGMARYLAQRESEGGF